MTRSNKFDVCVYHALTAVIVLAVNQGTILGAESKLLKFTICGVDFELVRIPSGEFQMGSHTGDSWKRSRSDCVW